MQRGGGTKPGLQLSEEQLNGELYVAWLKDTREKPSSDSMKNYTDLIEKGIRDKDVVLRSSLLGTNVSLCLSSMLSRVPVQKLDLYDNLVRDGGCEAIAHLIKECQTITHLNLGGNDIGSQSINSLAASLATHRKIQTLILGTGDNDTHPNQIDSMSGRNLAEAIGRSKILKHLDLNRNPLGHYTQDPFHLLAAFASTSPSLQILKLGSTELSTESAVDLIAAVARSANISYVDLHDNDLGYQVGEAIGTLLVDRAAKGGQHCLKTILLHNNEKIGPRGTAAIFRPLIGDRTLSHINVSRCGVDDASLSLLCNALAVNTTLNFIDLSVNLITDVGVVELARSLLRHPSVTFVSLSKNRIRDEGACALASALEQNKTLESLRLEDGRIADRGLIALGVSLVSNQTLTHLDVRNNHISENGGAAFGSLLTKNKSVQVCNIKGNSMHHSTALEIQSATSRNKRMKLDEGPNKLRKEVIRLHYQMYKLDEAKIELDAQQRQRLDIERMQERNEAAFREEESECRKRRKDLQDSIRDQEAQSKDIETRLKMMREEYKTFEEQHEVEMGSLSLKLEAEVQARKQAEADLEAAQQELKDLEQGKKNKLETLRQQIEEAKKDREHWITQKQEYKAKYDALKPHLTELEDAATAQQEERDRKEREAREAKEAKKAKKGKNKADDAIAALLS